VFEKPSENLEDVLFERLINLDLSRLRHRLTKPCVIAPSHCCMPTRACTAFITPTLPPETNSNGSSGLKHDAEFQI
jgi:hypothetical protein